jgi:hypothetical protein
MYVACSVWVLQLQGIVICIYICINRWLANLLLLWKVGLVCTSVPGKGACNCGAGVVLCTIHRTSCARESFCRASSGLSA